MAVGRSMPPLVFTQNEVQELKGIASSRSLPHSSVQRAQIVLACGAGETNTDIATDEPDGMTVRKYANVAASWGRRACTMRCIPGGLEPMRST